MHRKGCINIHQNNKSKFRVGGEDKGGGVNCPKEIHFFRRL